MIGKRVKPRLWWLANVGSAVAMAASIGAMVGVIWAIVHFEFLSAHSALATIVFIGIPIIAFYVALYAFTVGLVTLGWLTRQEAAQLLRKGHHWPDAWLEPIDEIRSG